MLYDCDPAVRNGEESRTRNSCEENVLTALKGTSRRLVDVTHKQRVRHTISNGDCRSPVDSYIPNAALLGLNGQIGSLQRNRNRTGARIDDFQIRVDRPSCFTRAWQ